MPTTNLPEVSLIVRTMGRAELTRALAALANQSYAAIQVVLVVATPEWSPAANVASDKITVVAPGLRLPRPQAANAGLAAARGNWIGFLDEDDWIEPDHVAGLMQNANAARPSRILYSDLTVHDGTRHFVRSVGYWKRKQAESPIASINSFLIERSLVERDGCRFDPSFELLEDWDFLVQCAEHSDLFHVANASAHYAAEAGTSGGGFGANRNFSRLQPFIEKMNAKWGRQYVELAAFADQALAQGHAARKQGDWRRAEVHARAGLARDPGNPFLLNLLSYCRLQAGDRDGVVTALRRACDSEPNSFALQFDLAAIEYRYGDKQRAPGILAKARMLCQTPEQTARVNALGAEIGHTSPS